MAFLMREKKGDLMLLARDMGKEIPGEATKIQLRDSILSGDFDEETIKDWLEGIKQERAEEREQAERDKNRAHELEMERLRVQALETERAMGNRSSFSGNDGSSREKSVDEIIRTIRLLTVKVPSKPEGWNYFFSSLEKAFDFEKVAEELKARILLGLLGEKAANLFSELESDQYGDYEAVKKLVLKEFEPSPKACLENFRRARRNADENFMQYASRLTAAWSYYCKLRGAHDFETVNQLIVADKIMSSLDGDTTAHILVRQGETWFKPKALAQECDQFFSAAGKSYSVEKGSELIRRDSDRGRENVKERETGCFACGVNGHLKRDCPNGGRGLKRNQSNKQASFNCFACGSKGHYERDCPKVDRGFERNQSNKGVMVNRATEMETDGYKKNGRESPVDVEETQERVVIASVRSFPENDVITRGKLQYVNVKINGNPVRALLDSGSEITVIRGDILGKGSFKNLPSICLKGIFGPPVKCPLVRAKLSLNEGDKSLCFPKEVVCAVVKNLDYDVLIPPDIMKQLKGSVNLNVNQTQKMNTNVMMDRVKVRKDLGHTGVFMSAEKREFQNRGNKNAAKQIDHLSHKVGWRRQGPEVEKVKATGNFNRIKNKKEVRPETSFGECLEHKYKQGNFKPMGFGSRKLENGPPLKGKHRTFCSCSQNSKMDFGLKNGEGNGPFSLKTHVGNSHLASDAFYVSRVKQIYN